MDERASAFSAALGSVKTTEHEGVIYMDIDVIEAINLGILQALDSQINPSMEMLPPAFIGGVVFALDMYRRLHAGMLDRHAGDLVPDHIPDGMDGVVE